MRGEEKKSWVAELSAMLPRTAPLAVATVRRLVRAHVGFEAFVEPLIKVAEEFGAQLGAGGFDVDDMRASLKTYRELGPQLAEAIERVRILEHSCLIASANTWTQMLAIYGRARQAARSNPDIADAIDAFGRFMKTGPRKTTATSPTKGH